MKTPATNTLPYIAGLGLRAPHYNDVGDSFYIDC
jgi:hypothetical protein